MKLLKIITFFHCLVGLFGLPVPLVLWGENTPKMPALYIMQPYELQEIIFTLMDRHTIVLFIENDLTSKDFLCINPMTNDTCFRYMRTMDKLNYYTQVHNPIETIEAIVSKPPIKWQQFDLAAQKLKPFVCRVGQVHGFEFTDEYATRVEQLIAHDAMIAEFTWNMDCPLVQIYTTRGKPSLHRQISLYELYRAKEQAKVQRIEYIAPPKSKHRKAYKPEPDVVDYFFISEYFALRYQFVYLLRSTGRTINRSFYGQLHRKARNPTPGELRELVTISGITSEQKDDEKGFIVNFDSTPVHITLNLLTVMSYDGVRYRTVTVDFMNYAMLPFNVPDNRSYCCGLLEVYGSDKSLLTFHNVQFEALRLGRNDSEQFEFGEPIYCTGILTPDIMGGLAVAFIMVFIGGFGLIFILDIGSNARMDDASGPDLQIKAHD